MRKKIIILFIGAIALFCRELPQGYRYTLSLGLAEEYSSEDSKTIYDDWPKPIFSFGIEKRRSPKTSWTLEAEARPFRIKRVSCENLERGLDVDITEYFFTYSYKRLINISGINFYARGYVGLAFTNFFEKDTRIPPPSVAQDEYLNIGAHAGIGMGVVVLRPPWEMNFEVFVRWIATALPDGYGTNFFGAKLGFSFR